MSTHSLSSQQRQQTPWWRLVAEREVTTRVREKSFLIGLGITVAFVVGFFVAASFGGGPEEYDVAVVGDSDAALVQQVEDTLTAGGGGDADATTVTAVGSPTRTPPSGP